MEIFKKRLRKLIFITVLMSNIGCDQISKDFARNSVEYGERISILSSYLTLTKVENSGAFLSLGKNLSYIFKITILTIIPVLVLMSMLAFVLIKRKLNLNYGLPIAFIVGGGIGNLYDRIRYGSVTDFLHIDFQLFQTGIFNMADVSIMIGTFWLLFLQLNLRNNRQIKTH